MEIRTIKKTLIAVSVGAALATSGNAVAQTGGNLMLGFNPFGGSTAMPASAGAPNYLVGVRVSDELMPFGYGAINDRGGNTDTQLTFGGGMRYYMGHISSNVRPFAGGALGITNAADTGFQLAGFFGAEAMVTEQFSVSGQVGLDIMDRGGDADTQFALGSANVMFNLYF